MTQHLAADLHFNLGGEDWNLMFGVNSSILIPFIRTSIFLILAGTTRVDWSSIQYLYFTAEIWLWVVLYTDDVHTTMAKEFHISILTFRYQVRLRWRQFAQDFKFMYFLIALRSWSFVLLNRRCNIVPVLAGVRISHLTRSIAGTFAPWWSTSISIIAWSVATPHLLISHRFCPSRSKISKK